MKFIYGLSFLLVPVLAFGIVPQFWEENTQQQFADGDPQSISITSDGELLLAPQLKKVYEGVDSVIWKIVRDSADNLYAATGNEGKILKIDPAGKATVLLDTNELEVHVLVLDKEENLYAATSPDGKIYQVKRDGTSKVFYDPADKYIWSLAFDDSGNLYAGTGDQGKIYKIDREGKGTVLIDTNETNITALAWDGKSLLAGSDRGGILYRIDSTGKAFVLFDTDLQQVTSIYLHPSGEIYFSAISGLAVPVEPKPAAPQQPPAQIQVTPPSESADFTANNGDEAEVTTSVEIGPFAPPQPTIPAKPTGASQLFRINSDGVSELLYTATEDQILDIAGYKEDVILLSTGKKAKLILLDKNKKSTILLKTPEDQITNLLKEERILLSTANPGNIYELVEDHSSKGTYYSDIKDTLTSSTWGRINWKATTPEGTSIGLSTRSGNTKTPDETWSDWHPAGTDAVGRQIGSPKARFIQWKADFSTTNDKVSPVLRTVRLAYLQQNIRPEVVSILLHPSGTVYKRAAVFPQESFAGVAENPGTNTEQQNEMQQITPGFGAPFLGKREYKKGFQTLTWNAADQNQDNLSFDIQYRSVDEKGWKQLAKNLRESVFAWDTQTIPDGTYQVKVIVSDTPSNPQEFALSNSRESDPFHVDNSAPTIEVVRNAAEKNMILLEVRAQDQFSPLKELQYSVAPGIWNIVFPVDSINDSLTETYRIELRNLPTEVTNIILRVSDQLNNVSTIQHTLSR